MSLAERQVKGSRGLYPATPPASSRFVAPFVAGPSLGFSQRSFFALRPNNPSKNRISSNADDSDGKNTRWSAGKTGHGRNSRRGVD